MNRTSPFGRMSAWILMAVCFLPVALRAEAQAPSMPIPQDQAVIDSGDAGTAGMHRLTGVETTTAHEEVRVLLATDGKVTARPFVLESPDRLVVDLQGVTSTLKVNRYELNSPVVSRVRVGQRSEGGEPVARVVLDLNQAQPYRIDPSPRGLLVTVGSQGGAAATAPVAAADESDVIFRATHDDAAAQGRLTLKTFEGNGVLAKTLEDLNYKSMEEFYAAVGYGKVTAFQLAAKLVPQDSLEERKESILGRAVRRALGLKERKVKVSGFEDMMIYLAKCCHPIPGDGIVGYITRGKGVSVHSLDCRNVVNLLYAPERRIDVEWESDGEALYEVTLALHSKDQQGILAKIVSTISDEKTNIRNVDAKSLEEGRGLISLSLDIKDRAHMDRVIARLRKIEGVDLIERILK